MREHVLVTTADVSADRLWTVAADVRDWAAWQPRSGPSGIASVHTALCSGGWTCLTVEEAAAPARLTAVAERFLARIRFEYGFEPCPRGTRVRVAVALQGPLRFAYQRSFDRHMQLNLSVLVARLIERARGCAGPSGSPPIVPASSPRSNTRLRSAAGCTNDRDTNPLLAAAPVPWPTQSPPET